MSSQSAESGSPVHPHVDAVRAYLDNGGITPETLRYAATHEALCRSWIFDLLTNLADVMEEDTRLTPPVVGSPGDLPIEVEPSAEPTTLACGCVFTPGTPGRFEPCGEFHRDLAKRLRRPGASWVIVR